MKLFIILFTLLRYRVALMLLIFFLFGLVTHTHNLEFDVRYILAALSLSFSYIAATSINDIVDVKVDMINHPKGLERPLISGQATRKDMLLGHIVACILALSCALLIGGNAILIIAVSLLVNYLYSVPPFQISYKTYFAPLLLAIAYVFIPYWLGVDIALSKFGESDIILLGILLLLFCGRIVLKDFRDREGDKKYGKPTLILTHGKVATILISAVFVFLGNILLYFYINNRNYLYLLFLEFFFLGIYYQLYRLWKAIGVKEELLVIGLGAKVANGLLLTLLGLVLLQSSVAKENDILLFLLTMIVFYGIAFLYMKRDSKKLMLSYKG